jgi:hypothetical protein
VKWAKLARMGGQHRGQYHAWKQGALVCAIRSDTPASKFQRDRQPFNACSLCLRALGLAPKQLEALHA